MQCTLSELRGKEIISLKTGEKLGYVDDVEFDTHTAVISALIIFGSERFFGLFGRDDDIKIAFSDIHLIGRDAVLVNGENGGLAEKKRFVFDGTAFKS